MKIYSNVHVVKIMCRIQKQLLSLSQFLSYFSLINFLTDLVRNISRQPYEISMKLNSNVYEGKTVRRIKKDCSPLLSFRDTSL